MCFFEDFRIYSGLWPLSVSPRCQGVYTMAGQTPAMKQNWQNSENSQHFKEKTQYLMNTLYLKIKSQLIHIWKKMCKTILLDLIENNDCVQQETDIIWP